MPLHPTWGSWLDTLPHSPPYHHCLRTVWSNDWHSPFAIKKALLGSPVWSGYSHTTARFSKPHLPTWTKLVYGSCRASAASWAVLMSFIFNSWVSKLNSPKANFPKSLSKTCWKVLVHCSMGSHQVEADLLSPTVSFIALAKAGTFAHQAWKSDKL